MAQRVYYATPEGGRIDEEPSTPPTATGAEDHTAQAAAAPESGPSAPNTEAGPPAAADYPASLNIPDPAYTPLATITSQALPAIGFDPALANVTSVTGVVQAILQEAKVSNYSLTLSMGVPLFGSRTPQQIQVLLKGQTAAQLAPCVRPGMVLQAVGALHSPAKSSMRLLASSLSEVVWESLPPEMQEFYSLAAQEKSEKPPPKPKSTGTAAAQKVPYENQRQQYETVLQYGSFEGAAQALEVKLKTVTDNVWEYVEATAPEYINWAAILSISGVALNDADPVQPTVKELMEAVEAFRPIVTSNPDYLTRAGMMRLRALLDYISSQQRSSPLWRKLEPHARPGAQLDYVYRVLRAGRYIADMHLDPGWMASHVPQEPPRPDPAFVPEPEPVHSVPATGQYAGNQLQDPAHPGAPPAAIGYAPQQQQPPPPPSPQQQQQQQQQPGPPVPQLQQRRPWTPAGNPNWVPQRPPLH